MILFYDSNIYKVGNRKGKVVISEAKDIETINMLIANEANEILAYNPSHEISTHLREYAQRTRLNARPFKLFKNGQCKISLFRILDKAKYLNLNSCYQEDLYREYTNFLSKNPELKQHLKSLGGSASAEDRRKFYEELKNRK